MEKETAGQNEESAYAAVLERYVSELYTRVSNTPGWRRVEAASDAHEAATKIVDAIEEQRRWFLERDVEGPVGPLQGRLDGLLDDAICYRDYCRAEARYELSLVLMEAAQEPGADRGTDPTNY